MIGIRIGERRKSPGPGDVTARLRDCHGRIRSFLDEAAALARGEGEPGPRKVSAGEVARYFRIALPLHEADEDASIAPRLAGGTRIVLGLLEEHGEIDRRIDRLARDWERWARGEEIADLEGHRRELVELRAIMDEHLAREEAHVFPRIDALPLAERLAIVAEIDARRR